MVILITGASHTGKTALAQRLLERHHYPYLSIDHLKMGLIRSGETTLTPEDDAPLTPYLWGIVSEMIKTVIENQQNLIIEGCYIPFDWEGSFSADDLKEIKFYCLVMTADYIHRHFENIKAYANTIEQRIEDDFSTKEYLFVENAYNLAQCQKYGYTPILIEDRYEVDIVL